MSDPHTSAPEPNAPLHEHARRKATFEAEADALEQRGNRLSMVRLVLFFAAGAVLAAGISEQRGMLVLAGLGLFAVFGVAVFVHARVIQAAEGARVRRDIHARHMARIGGGWQKLPNTGATLIPPTHAYAWDVDLVGPGSLFQRIDVTHTERGERKLVDWLGSAASIEDALARQVAVAELAKAIDLRQELEAAALLAADGQKLEAGRFHELAQRPLLHASRGWLAPLSLGLPTLTALLYGMGQLALVPSKLWYVVVAVQLLVLRTFAAHVRTTLDLAAARQGVVEAFERMLIVVENARFEAPLLLALQRELAIGDVKPSEHVKRLRRWTGFAELRRQFLLYIVVNPLTLWDLHVLRGIEGWIRDVGRHTDQWFDALASLEALSSLATLAHAEPAATFPALHETDDEMRWDGLGHPLLAARTRVVNDVALPGRGTALVITGSNMAGKSTLLRAVGLNIALAWAGGPVIARRASVPRVRLRASMRADDSLQSGASYFHAELTKLRRVVEEADAQPPIFFLLDELLRGTNARARHLGARAVLLHLIARGGSGLVATHDAMLGQLEHERPGRVRNHHFTDVIIDGEMTFDYVLHPGVVRTSNALRLLALAGIDVPQELQDDNSVDGPAAPPDAGPVP